MKRNQFNSLLMILVMIICAQQGQAQSGQPTPEQIAERRRMFDQQLRTDWAQTRKYEESNLRTVATGKKAGPVFIGDSITEFWSKYDSAYWKDNGYINRGISGQTSSQMLVRFRRDVIALKPVLVLINAGTNDIAENTGPIALEHVLGNIVSMVEIAKANQIPVVLSSVLPAAAFPWRKEIEPTEKVIKLNAMIRDYATAQKIPYVDYWTAMADASKGLDSKYTEDGIHPILSGYKVMEQLAKKEIDGALKKNNRK